MKLLHRRLTVRRLMIVVAIVACGIGGWRYGESRRERFAYLEVKHKSLSLPRIVDGFEPGPSQEVADYHRAMANKYRFARQYPWLPVASDPPEPEPN
jgi:hypothetical protein